ncbi:MAG: response regulator transcription factor [Methylocella sp.]
MPSSPNDQITELGQGTRTVANFAVQGTDYVVINPRARGGERLEVVGQLKIDGKKFAIGRCSNHGAGEDALGVLSPRELEIARCVAAGYQTKAIAQRLRISYYTVRVHIGRIYCKLGLHKQTELASWICTHFDRQRID